MLPIVEKRSIIKAITVSWVGYWFNFDGSILSKILGLVKTKQSVPAVQTLTNIKQVSVRYAGYQSNQHS